MNGLDYTTLNSTSNDGKVKFIAHGNQKNPPPHQANSEYNMIVKTFEVTSGNTGEYVLKIDHYGQGTKNIGLGGFTFIPIIDYPILTMNIPAKATNSDSITITSDKDCKLFMVPDTVTKDSVAFEAAVLGGYGKAISDVKAENDTVIKFDGLADGNYVFYGVITKDLISDISDVITLVSDANPPSFVNLPMYPAYDSGSSFMVTVDETATVYLVHSGTAPNKSAIIADSITGAFAADSGDVTISTLGLQDTVYMLAAIDAFDNVATSKLIRIGDLTQKPYKSHTISLTDTTRIEAEHYDTGGYNVAYYDKDFARGNIGDSLRPNDFVGLEFTAGASGPDTTCVGYINNGEWLKYSVNVSDAGYYNFTCRYTRGKDKKILFRMDGVDITDTLTVTNAGTWKQFGTISQDSIYLSAGNKVLEVHCITTEYNLDYFEFTPALDLDVTAPVISVAAESVSMGTAFAVTADDTCTAYIVPTGTSTNNIVASAAYSVILSAGVAGNLATDTLLGNYMIYAIDSVGNVS
ncbi:MAG: carbohydrate-binding protein, partial [Bacteroidales bacterium]|nr:carbohydrate-binding protein [Bacteroidales bacterium]